MSNLTSVHVTDGVPDTGTGDVSTLDAVLAVLPAALASHGGLKVEGVASGVTIPVSDGAGSLTVDGAISFTAPQHVIVDSGVVTVDNGGTFAVQATLAAGAAAIAKAEDAASANADVGVPAMAIQKATPADTAGTDGDYAMLQMSAGRLWTSATISDGGGSITVDGTVSIGDLPIAVSVSGQPIYGEDDPSSNGQNGYAILATRKATPANTSGADGDYEFFQMSAGRLWTSAVIDTALPAGTNVIGHVIVDSGTITTVSTLTTITNAVLVKGGTAADAALANAPVTIGGRATNTNLAEMSADGDVVDAQMTMQGAQVVAHAPRELLGNQQTQISNSTSETTIITAASGVYNDLYGLILANTGASATKCSIRDDTAGTVRGIIYVPVGETRGFMLPAASAVSQTATNKNWTVTCGTATTALEVTALFVKRK